MIDHVLDPVCAGYAEPNQPGASVAVMRRGQIVRSRMYGLADVELQMPTTPETNYRLASLSKAFTALAIMLLAEAGQLSYDDFVRDLLPDFPAYGSAIRIRHLLNHTSGIWDYEDFVSETQPVQVTDHDVLALLAPLNRSYFAPGTAYRYSNSGYVLLALVVEAISGVPFAQFLQQRIFVPLGMRTTVAYQAGVSTIAQRAWGYTVTPGGTIRTDQSATSATLGDGGIYSSVVDLAAWDRALATYALVSPATWQAALTPPRLPNGTRTKYGFGWFIATDQHGQRQWHHGETTGFTNGIVRYPKHNLTVVILTNRTGGAPWISAQQIAAALL